MDHLQIGQEAMERGALDEARTAFEAALAELESAQAHEGLSAAAAWLDDGAVAISSGERAYRLFTEAGDDIGAARTAVLLADHYYLFRSQSQVSQGWIHRARSLLDGKPLSREHGYLAAEAGFLAFQDGHDAVAAGRFGAEAAACGRALGVVDLTMYGMALQGLAKVSMGDVGAGMALLDESSIAATSGEVADPGFANIICCYLIYACEWVNDFVRAAQWCARLRIWCEEMGDPTFLAICRTHYAGVLMWQGEWNDAEEHLRYATEVLSPVRPVLALEAHMRLGELRRRQGRWDEAVAAFDQAEHQSHTLVGRAAMALDRGDPEEAIRWAERLLRRLAPEAHIERMAALDIVVRSRIALADANVTDAVTEMWSIARTVGTAAARARVLAAEGICSAGVGEHARAIPWLEDAADLFDESGGPFEAACTRVDLADSLAAVGRTAAAERELAHAEAALRALGAEYQLERAIGVRSSFSSSRAATPVASNHGLTARELEVLQLVADGHSNAAIAEALVLSIRTVERHLATIYEKLQFDGRNARAAAVSFAHREQLVRR